MRVLTLWAGIFVVITLITLVLLTRAMPFSYVSRGVLEIGYYNPRDYLPHPVISTAGLAAMVGDPDFLARVTRVMKLSELGVLDLRAAPLEDGLLRVEGRSTDPLVSQRGAVLACSLVAARTNEGFDQERVLTSRQLGTIRQRLAAAESLIHREAATEGARAEALRALAHFTELEIETETEAELIAQKKRTRILVAPGKATQERPVLALVAMGPAAVVTVVVAAGMVARRSRRRERPA
jgi:hypothetical protein